MTAKPGWSDEFRTVERVLRDALGPRALRIDHIGSTAVPGLDAKDVIDVQVSVASLDVGPLIEAFAKAGFETNGRIWVDHLPPGVEGPESDWQKLFFNPLDGRPVNVHVRVAGRANTRYALLFRDYLRAHPSTAEAYARLKKNLAALGLDRATYADTKDPACDLIVIPAEEWAARTGWKVEG